MQSCSSATQLRVCSEKRDLSAFTGRDGPGRIMGEDQRDLNGGNWQLVKEFVEVESGKKADRPQLEKAFQLCRLIGARLVIAKLDRLSRDAHFLLGLEKAGVDFVAADMPNANRLTVDKAVHNPRRIAPIREHPGQIVGQTETPL